jgi:hypothetical protein
VWECQYSRSEKSGYKQPAGFDEDCDPPKKPWRFRDDPKFEKQIWTLPLPNTGDCAVVFRYEENPKTKICFIPRPVIGSSGRIFVYEDLGEGKKGWQPAIDRWGSSGRVVQPRSEKTFEVAIADFYGNPGDLLCTNMALENLNTFKNKREALDEFRCCYIDPEGITEVEADQKSWIAESVRNEPPKIELKDLIAPLMEASKKKNDERLWKSTSEFIEKIAENSVPDVTAGTATLPIIANFIAQALAATAQDEQRWFDMYASGAASVEASVFQAGFELFGGGFLTILRCVAIHRLRKKKTLTPAEKQLLKEHTKELFVLLARDSVAFADGINAVVGAVSMANFHGTPVGPLNVQGVPVDPTGMGATIAGAGAFGAVLSSAVNLFIAGRNFRQVDKARIRRKDFDATAKQIKTLIGTKGEEGTYVVHYDKDEDRTDHQSSLQALCEYSNGKLSRRIGRKATTGAVALVSSLGGVATTLAVVSAFGLANIWNPIGWALGALAILGGIALTCYVIHRRRTRKKRHEELAKKNMIAKPEEFADKLLNFYVETNDNKDLRDEGEALLLTYVDRKTLDTAVQKQDFRPVKTEIVRHFK